LRIGTYLNIPIKDICIKRLFALAQYPLTAYIHIMHFELNESDDMEVLVILRDHARQLRIKGSSSTAVTAAKAEKALDEMLSASPKKTSNSQH